MTRSRTRLWLHAMELRTRERLRVSRGGNDAQCPDTQAPEDGTQPHNPREVNRHGRLGR